MNEKLPLWPLKMGEGRQDALEESHELSSCTGKLGNLTLEDDGSCGHLSLNKTVRSIVTTKCGGIWKYALGHELTDPGFDYSVLSEFRTRLIAGGGEHLLLEAMLTYLQERGLGFQEQSPLCAAGHNGVAPQLTVVMSTTVPRDAEAHGRDARAASEESSAAAARETPAVPGWSSNDP
jgi:hypothetical protein